MEKEKNARKEHAHQPPSLQANLTREKRKMPGNLLIIINFMDDQSHLTLGKKKKNGSRTKTKQKNTCKIERTKRKQEEEKEEKKNNLQPPIPP